MKPKPLAGLRHIALFVVDLAACEHFYVNLLGMKIDWRPDADNLFLTSGSDNLALHRAPKDFQPGEHQRLDHLGFLTKERGDVDDWFNYLSAEGATIKAKPKDHRDGSRSFYCADPAGNVVQFIYFQVTE